MRYCCDDDARVRCRLTEDGDCLLLEMFDDIKQDWVGVLQIEDDGVIGRLEITKEQAANLGLRCKTSNVHTSMVKAEVA